MFNPVYITGGSLGISSTIVSMETLLPTVFATSEMHTKTHTTPQTVLIESSNHPIMTTKSVLATPIEHPTVPIQNVNVGLHVGITVAMLVLALLVTLTILLVCFVMKKRGNRPKGGTIYLMHAQALRELYNYIRLHNNMYTLWKPNSTNLDVRVVILFQVSTRIDPIREQLLQSKTDTAR